MRKDYSNKTITVRLHGKSQQFAVDHYYDIFKGKSWARSMDKPEVRAYALRVMMFALPNDDMVLHGKIGKTIHLVHVSEILGG